MPRVFLPSVLDIRHWVILTFLHQQNYLHYFTHISKQAQNILNLFRPFRVKEVNTNYNQAKIQKWHFFVWNMIILITALTLKCDRFPSQLSKKLKASLSLHFIRHTEPFKLCSMKDKQLCHWLLTDDWVNSGYIKMKWWCEIQLL